MDEFTKGVICVVCVCKYTDIKQHVFFNGGFVSPDLTAEALTRSSSSSSIDVVGGSRWLKARECTHTLL